MTHLVHAEGGDSVVGRLLKRAQGHGSSQEDTMAVAKVSEISSTSAKSFEDAIQQGISRASTTLRHIRSAWVKEQRVRCEEGRIVEYQVNLKITFVLD
jgi:dodecin